jgi:hypothetical protein
MEYNLIAVKYYKTILTKDVYSTISKPFSLDYLKYFEGYVSLRIESTWEYNYIKIKEYTI